MAWHVSKAGDFTAGMMLSSSFLSSFPFFFCPMTMFAAFTQPGHYEIPVEKTALYSRE